MIDSPSLSWLKSEFWIAGIAAAGGIIVLIGLWKEYVSTDEKRYEKTDIKGFRLLKALEKRGEIWVMVGIVIEIAVAVGFAWRDDWHIRQMEIANKNADTRNLPIKSISGYARVVVRLSGNREMKLAGDLHETGPNSEPLFSNVEMNKSETVLLVFGKHSNSDSEEGLAEMGIVGQVVFVGRIGARHPIYDPNICFDLIFDSTKQPNFWNPNDVTFNELKFVQIEGLGKDELQLPIEVIEGRIVLSVNGFWPKTFLIPQQTNQFWRVSSFETNNEFVAAGYGILTNAQPVK